MAENLERRLQKLTAELSECWQKINLDQKISELAELETVIADPELWRRPDFARAQHERAARLEEEVHPWQLLCTQVADLGELLALGDAELATELSSQVDGLEQNLAELRKALRFTGKFDANNAILRVTAGAGGVEAMDWAEMLERMYLRFFERRGLKASCLERVAGEEAGIKTAVYEVTGTNAYGLLRSENGVHRLVRLSPFNADNLRQTSFALVEILPVLNAENEIALNDKDLRIDVYHSGGNGGQSVNTTNSAVRITHLPTGIVVAIQNERSQLQNKTKALEILRGKLAKLQEEQQAESINNLRAGESASWGQQIRNYVLQPYKLVKDTRTKFESKDPEAVLDGKLDDFIDAFLENPTAAK